MRNPLQSPSTREHRLLFQQAPAAAAEMGPPEPLENRALRLLDKPNPEAELAELMKEIQKPEERSQMLDALAEKVRREPQNPDVKLAIIRNQQNLERQAAIGAQKKEQEGLRRNVDPVAYTMGSTDRAPEAPPASETPARPPQEWLKPGTWSPERWENVKGAAIVVGAVAGTVWLWHKIRDWFGEKAEAVKEKSSAGWSWFTKILGVGLLAGGAYLGWKGLKNAAKAMLEEDLKRMREEYAKLKEEASKMKDGAEAKRDVLLERIHDLERKLGKPETREAAADAAQEVGKMAAFPLTARSLLTMYPTEDWNLSENSKRKFVTEVLGANGETPMQQVFASIRTPGFRGPIDETMFHVPTGLTPEDRSNRFRAAHFVLDRCFEYRDQLLKSGKTQEEIDHMGLLEFISASIGTHAAVGKVLEATEAAGGDVTKAIQSLDIDSLAEVDSGLQNELEEFRTELGTLTEGEKRVSPLALLQASRTLTGSVSGIITAPEQADEPAGTKTIRRLCQSMEREQIWRYMVPFFHQLFPEGDTWDTENMDNNVQTVKRYVLERMSVQQAIRMYLYARMVRKGNPAAMAMMQVEITHFTGRHDKSFGGRIWKQQVIRAGRRAWSGGWQEWEASGITIPKEALKNLDRTMQWLVPRAIAGGIGAVIKGAEETAGTVIAGVKEAAEAARTHRTETAGLAAGAVAAGFGVRQLGNIVDPYFVGSTQEFVDRMKNASHSNILLRSKALKRARFDAARAVEELDHTLENLSRTNPALHAAAEDGRKALNQFLKTDRSLPELTKLRASLARIPPGSAKCSTLLGKIEGYLPTLQKFRWGSRIASAPLRFAGQVLNVPAQTVKALGGATKTLGKVGGIVLTTGLAAREAKNFYLYELPELQKKLDAEQDPLKKDLIQNEINAKKLMLAAETAASTGSFLGFKWNLYALGASAALHGGDALRGQISDSTWYMLQNRKDLLRNPPGNILYQVQRSAPGMYTSWEQKTAATSLIGSLDDARRGNRLDARESFEAGNTSSRSEAYAAYFRQNAVLPPINDTILTPEERKDPARARKRMETLTEDQITHYTQAALAYIGHQTKNSFVLVSPDILRRAQEYAFASLKDWVLQITGQKSTFGKLSWAEKEKVISEQLQKNDDYTVTALNEALAQGEKRADILPFFLLERMKEELALGESSILSTDFSNWTSARNWRLENWLSEENMQDIARGAYGWKIYSFLKAFSAETGPVTRERLAYYEKSLRSALTGNPDTEVQEAMRKGYKKFYTEIGSNRALLSPDGMLGYIQQRDAGSQQAPQRLAA